MCTGENEASVCVCQCFTYITVFVVRPVRGSFAVSLNDDGVPAPAHKRHYKTTPLRISI